MNWLWDLNLIRFFEFYLFLAFLVSTTMRLRQYESVIRLVRAVPKRWPRLLQLVKQHHGVFLTWSTMLPAGLAFFLYVLHSIACRLIWPQAALTVNALSGFRLALPVVIVLGAAMLGVDLYATFKVGNIDRPLLERYFDQAEYWLRSWVAPALNLFTLGYVNPRKMVTAEVRKALLEASRLLNATLWWVTVQVGLRIAFGLGLWLTYALSTQQQG
ncbi:MAG TPA: hypothetical protein VK395_10705 [Gemmataceae bacterium]|nr:hypothetical protein [Gemmataceae bacterium]